MKKSLSKKTILLTHPVLIIGTYDAENIPNIATVAWGGICCSEPPSIAISLRKNRHTYQNIMLNKAFTVNIPSEKYLPESDYVGIYSGKNENKFQTTNLTPVKSELVNAPYILEFPLSLICKLTHTLEIGVHTQFIGEILDVLAEDSILGEKDLPDIKKVKPFIFDTASVKYYGIGEAIGNAYSNVKHDL